MKKQTKEELLKTLLSGKSPNQYKGRQVVILRNKVYILPNNDKEAAKLVNSLILKNPGVTPTITFVPKEGTYILILE